MYWSTCSKCTNIFWKSFKIFSKQRNTKKNYTVILLPDYCACTYWKLPLSNHIEHFCSGNGINVLKIAPENAVKFLTYDEIKGMMIHSGDVNKTLNSFDRALAAGIAGIVAHTVIYPLEVLSIFYFL